MDALRLDALAQALTNGSSRRGLLSGITATALALTATPFPGEGEAKQRHHRHKKKRKRKNRRRRQEATAPLASPPDPVTTADAACLPAGTTGGLTNALRFAQSFVAPRGGQLNSASVTLTFNLEGADFDMEIRDLDAAGKPVGALLASATIADVPATSFSGPPRTITGTFGSPATVVAGQSYALVVADLTGRVYGIQANINSNSCSGGNLFIDAVGNRDFQARMADDLVFATVVTA